MNIQHINMSMNTQHIRLWKRIQRKYPYFYNFIMSQISVDVVVELDEFITNDLYTSAVSVYNNINPYEPTNSTTLKLFVMMYKLQHNEKEIKQYIKFLEL